MNYYPFHIGDYMSATRHLSWDEDAAYRRLLDSYYTTEKPLPADERKVFRLVVAGTEEQREAVRVVLQEFFTLTGDGWVNDRADREIATMRDKQQKQRDKANKRWHKPEQEHSNAPAMPWHTETCAVAQEMCADAMPPTPTPTPTPTEITPRETIVSLVANDVGSKVEKPEKVPDCPQQQIVELFGELLPELPQPRAWEGQRANNLKARWRWVLTAKRKCGERYATDAQTGIEFFRRMFGYVRESDFLMGRGKAGWLGCDLGWLVKSENFEKVLAGNYENREAAA